MDAQRITFGPALIERIPVMLGYWPADSLVLATARSARGGRERRLGPCLRLDFSSVDARRLGASDGRDCADRLARAAKVDTIFPIVFSDPLARFHLEWDDDSPCSRAEISGVADLYAGLEAMCGGLAERGLEVLPALWSGCGRMGTQGRPDSIRRATGTKMIGGSEGTRAVAATFEDSVRPRTADPVTRAALDALRRERFDDEEAADGLLAEALLLDARAGMRERGGDGAPPLVVDPLAVLALERLCTSGADRDIVQMLLAGDHPQFRPARLRLLAPGEFLADARARVRAPDAAAQVTGLSAVPPRHEALAEAIDWLRTCAALVEDRARPDVLALIAWFEWARGRMSFAERFAADALAERTDHRMARMLRDAADTGMAPRWMRIPGD